MRMREGMLATAQHHPEINLSGTPAQTCDDFDVQTAVATLAARLKCSATSDGAPQERPTSASDGQFHHLTSTTSGMAPQSATQLVAQSVEYETLTDNNSQPESISARTFNKKRGPQAPYTQYFLPMLMATDFYTQPWVPGRTTSSSADTADRTARSHRARFPVSQD